MKPLLAVVILALVIGCTSLEPRQAQLVGEWLYADEIQSCRYAFKPNGSFNGEVKQHQKTISRFTGRWSVKQDALFYTYLSDVFGRIPSGAKDRDRLLEVGRYSFVIEAANGERRRYLRVR